MGFVKQLTTRSVCIFGIVRCYYVGQPVSSDQTCKCRLTPAVSVLNLKTNSGTGASGAMWSQVEVSVGVVSACLPVYRPLFVRRVRSSYADLSRDRVSVNPRSIQLFDRGGEFGSWASVETGIRASRDIEGRQFVKLSDPSTIQRDATFIITTEDTSPRTHE